jgi:thymidylate kinase
MHPLTGPPPVPSDSRSKFLVIEGCNGVGKSTLARYLGDRLNAVLFHYPPEFTRFRQEANLDEAVATLPRLVYYIGATLQLADLVRSQLARGHVICDRYLSSPLSLLISQGEITEEEICRIAGPFDSYLCVPDMVLLLTADYSTATARIRKRASEAAILTPVQRWVLDSPEFYYKREAALRRFARWLGPLIELDTTRLSVEKLCSSAWMMVAQSLELTTGGR